MWHRFGRRMSDTERCELSKLSGRQGEDSRSLMRVAGLSGLKMGEEGTQTRHDDPVWDCHRTAASIDPPKPHQLIGIYGIHGVSGV